MPGEETARCHALDGHHRSLRAQHSVHGPSWSGGRGAGDRAASSRRRARRLREGHVARFWPKRAAGAANANATVAERDSDMGGGAVFHDNRVEVTAGL